MSVSRLRALASVFFMLGPLAINAQTAMGLEYEMRGTESSQKSSDQRPSTYHVQVLNGQSRISASAGGDALLVSADGLTMTVLRPDKQTYTTMSTDKFENIIGNVLAMVKDAAKILQLELRQALITPQHMGSGGTLLGYPTEQSRLTYDYTMRVGAMGFTTDTKQRVVVDYWTTTGVDLPHNPLVELLATANSALAQADADFRTKSRAARSALMRGTILRVRSTSYDMDADSKNKRDKTPDMHMVEITSVAKANLRRDAFVIPSNYRLDKDAFSVHLGK